MTTLTWIGAFIIAMIVFFAMDMVWLGLIAQDFYTEQLGELKRPSPNWVAAFSFYAIFLAGLLWLCVRPVIDDGGSILGATLNGAIFGLVTYATWDLTNAAVIRGFGGWIVPVDMAWGTILSGSVATVTTYVVRRLWL